MAVPPVVCSEIVEALEGLPVSDHEKSQHSKEYIRSRKQGSQSTDWKQENFSDKKKDMFTPLFLKEKIEFDSYFSFTELARVKDCDCLVFYFQNPSKSLFLLKNSRR